MKRNVHFLLDFDDKQILKCQFSFATLLLLRNSFGSLIKRTLLEIRSAEVTSYFREDQCTHEFVKQTHLEHWFNLEFLRRVEFSLTGKNNPFQTKRASKAINQTKRNNWNAGASHQKAALSRGILVTFFSFFFSRCIFLQRRYQRIARMLSSNQNRANIRDIPASIRQSRKYREWDINLRQNDSNEVMTTVATIKNIIVLHPVINSTFGSTVPCGKHQRNPLPENSRLYRILYWKLLQLFNFYAKIL